MEGMIRKMEASLKQGLKVFKEWPSKLKKGHWYAIRARDVVGMCFGKGRCNFFNSD
jgi:hypothetical protein